MSTDVEHSEGSEQTEEQQRIDAVAGHDRQIKTIQDWMDAEENRPETAEQRIRRERREKSKKIISAFSDGLSALSNMYFTTQYAPNMYNHERGSMTKAVDERIERAKAEREKKRDRYMNFALKLGDIENDRAKTLRELEAEQERRKIAQAKADQDAKRFDFEQSLWPDKKDEQKSKTNKAEQEAITAKAIADYAPEMQRKKGAVEDAKASSYMASADASTARAGYYRNGGSSGAKKHHFRGKEYLSDKDYTKDVVDAARQYNESHMEEVEVEDGKGGKKKERRYQDGFVPIVIEREENTAYGKRTVARKPEEYAGEVERRLRQEEEDNMPPSRRSNNDNTPPTRR